MPYSHRCLDPSESIYGLWLSHQVGGDSPRQEPPKGACALARKRPPTSRVGFVPEVCSQTCIKQARGTRAHRALSTLCTPPLVPVCAPSRVRSFPPVRADRRPRRALARWRASARGLLEGSIGAPGRHSSYFSWEGPPRKRPGDFRYSGTECVPVLLRVRALLSRRVATVEILF